MKASYFWSLSLLNFNKKLRPGLLLKIKFASSYLYEFYRRVTKIFYNLWIKFINSDVLRHDPLV